MKSDKSTQFEINTDYNSWFELMQYSRHEQQITHIIISKLK